MTRADLLRHLSQRQHLPAVSTLGCFSNGYSYRKIRLQYGTAKQTLLNMP